MKKKYAFYVFIILSITLLIVVFYMQKTTNLNIDKNYSLLFKNNSWNTSLFDKIPYKSWDEVEINIPISWETPQKIIIDKTKIKDINIKDIYINDEKISKDEINLINWWNLKIVWTTKNDWILEDKNYNDIIKIIDLEIKDEVKQNSFNWKLDITFSSYEINSNINNLIEITWEWKEFIKYVNIQDLSLKPTFYEDKVFISINKDTFSSWDYFILLQLKDNLLVPLDKKFTFIHTNNSTNIASITPKQVKNDLDSFIVLQWNWFNKVISIQLSNNIILQNTSFDIISDNVMSVKIPKWLEKWDYFFNIMTINWIIQLKNNKFTIN